MFFHGSLMQLGLPVNDVLQVFALQQAFVNSLEVLVFPKFDESILQILLGLQGGRTEPEHTTDGIRHLHYIT